MTEIALDKLRAWWSHRQGLDGSLTGCTPEEVLARTGWARSVGGCSPYLGFFARAGLDREVVDKAVANLDVHELPSARGCTYILPKEDFTLGLIVGSGAPTGDLADATNHLGVTATEIDRLCDSITTELGRASKPLDAAGLRRTIPDEIRNLGAEGKKRGLSTTLPLALGLLQARGRIRRVPVNGRLDQQRFGYVLWSPSPLDGGGQALEAMRTELARRYFSWAAPASLKHFRWFSGFTMEASKQAIQPLDLQPVGDTDFLLPPDLTKEFEKFSVPRQPNYSLLSGIDGIHLLHRDLRRLVDSEDALRHSPGGRPGRTLGDETDPQCPIVVDRGRIVGLWEFDVDANEIVCQPFIASNAAFKKAITATENYVRDQLGDARMTSLDSPKSRAPRVADLRAGR